MPVLVTTDCLRAGACHHGLPWADACIPLVPVLVTMDCLRAGCLGLVLVTPLVLAHCHGLPSGRIAFGLGCLRAEYLSTDVVSTCLHVVERILSILYYRFGRTRFRRPPLDLVICSILGYNPLVSWVPMNATLLSDCCSFDSAVFRPFPSLMASISAPLQQWQWLSRLFVSMSVVLA